jgi:putative ABC transport system substrate-binding protein
VDVIFAPTSPAALAAKEAGVPVVFALVGDPIAFGLVASIARPGGNATGLSNQSNDIATKRLEILREVVPAVSRVAILVNLGNPSTLLDMSEVTVAALKLGLACTPIQIRHADEIAPALAGLSSDTQVLYVPPNPLMFTNRILINTMAIGARLPTMYGTRDYLETGGLVSYGTNFSEQFRRVADYVDKILRGAKPSDIPVEQPTKFELAINLKTAKAIGLTIPESFLLRADEVIE